MELRHLRYFIAVAEEENVTRAAARLHVSQPPLSRQIQELESELGLLFFERTAKTIRLTSDGRRFLQEARGVVARVDQALEVARRLKESNSATLHIGYAPTPSAAVLPKLLRASKQAAPSSRVELHDLRSEELLAGIREEKLDAAVLLEPPPRKLRGLVFRPLASHAVVVAIARNHPWKARRSVTADAIRAEPLVGYSRNEYPDYHPWLAGVLGIRPARLQFAVECDSGTTLLAAVEAERGISVVPETLAATAGKRLRYLSILPSAPRVAVGIVHLAKRLKPELARAIASMEVTK